MRLGMMGWRLLVVAALAGGRLSAADGEKGWWHGEVFDLLAPSHEVASRGRSAAVTITVLQSAGEDFRLRLSWPGTPVGSPTKVEAWRSGECVACALERLVRKDRESVGGLVARLAPSVRSAMELQPAGELVRWFRLATTLQDRSARNIAQNLRAEVRGGPVEVTLDGLTYVVEFLGSQRYHRVDLAGPVVSLPKEAGLPEIVGLLERTLGSMGRRL
jgi:hypothetical protein